MSGPTLQRLIGTALIDSNFRAALLNGSRRSILNSFALPEEHIEIIMAIRADTLDQLAGEIHRRLIDSQELEPLPSLRSRAAFAGQPLEASPLRHLQHAPSAHAEPCMTRESLEST